MNRANDYHRSHVYGHRSRVGVRAYLLILASLFALSGQLVANSLAQELTKDFANDVFPVLRANCIACHNAQKAEGGLNLESFELALKGGDSGPGLIVGKSSESELLKRVRANDDTVMPPEGNNVGARRLTPEEIEWIQAWIDAGAPAGIAKSADSMRWRMVPDSVRPAYALASTPDGQFVAAGRGNQAIVYRWPAWDGPADSWVLNDPQTQTELATETPVTHLDLVQSIAMSPEGDRIATGGYRDVKIWRRVQGPQFGSLAVAMRGSQLMLSSPDGKSLARATASPAIEIVSSDSSRTTHRLIVPNSVAGMAWSADGASLLAVGSDASVHRFVIPAPEHAESLAWKPQASGRIDTPLSQLVLLDASQFVGITPEGKLAWWTATYSEGAPPIFTLQPRLAEWQGIVACRRWEEGGQPRLAVATVEGKVVLASAIDGSTLRVIDHGSPIADMIVASDSLTLFTAGNDGSTMAWKTSDGTMLWEQRLDYATQRQMERAQAVVLRQKSKVDRASARLPELEKATQAEVDAKNKLQEARAKIAEELAKKQAELEVQDKSVVDGESALNAAMQALEEAKKRAEQAQKDLEMRQQQRTAAQKTKSDVEMKLTTMDKTIEGAAQAIERAAANAAAFQSMLESEKKRLEETEQSAQQAQANAPSIPAVRIVLSRDQRSVVSAHADGSLRVMRADRGVPQGSHAGGFATYVGIAATPAGQIVAATEDGRAIAWNIANRWQWERTIGSATESPFSDRVTALDWSPNGETLLVGSGAPSRFGELKLVRVGDGNIVKDWGQVHSDSILVARFSPDGLSVATGAADKLVRLHRVDADEPPKTLEGHTHHVLGLAWHDDGHWLASASADNSVKVWEVESGTSLRTIPGFGKEVTALAFVGRSNQLLSTSADQQTRIHDASNGNLVRAMGGPADALYCAAVAGKAPIAMAAGQDGVLWIWQVDNGQALHQIK